MMLTLTSTFVLRNSSPLLSGSPGNPQQDVLPASPLCSLSSPLAYCCFSSMPPGLRVLSCLLFPFPVWYFSWWLSLNGHWIITRPSNPLLICLYDLAHLRIFIYFWLSFCFLKNLPNSISKAYTHTDIVMLTPPRTLYTTSNVLPFGRLWLSPFTLQAPGTLCDSFLVPVLEHTIVFMYRMFFRDF